jgi:hypothetical protein
MVILFGNTSSNKLVAKQMLIGLLITMRQLEKKESLVARLHFMTATKTELWLGNVLIVGMHGSEHEFIC